MVVNHGTRSRNSLLKLILFSGKVVSQSLQDTLSIMALVLNQNSVSTAIITAVIIASCIALLSVTPILLTGVYFYVGDVWKEMFEDRKRYLQWDRSRKDWNKQAEIEIRRRFIMITAYESGRRRRTSITRRFLGGIEVW